MNNVERKDFEILFKSFRASLQKMSLGDYLYELDRSFLLFKKFHEKSETDHLSNPYFDYKYQFQLGITAANIQAARIQLKSDPYEYIIGKKVESKSLNEIKEKYNWDGRYESLKIPKEKEHRTAKFVDTPEGKFRFLLFSTVRDVADSAHLDPIYHKILSEFYNEEVDTIAYIFLQNLLLELYGLVNEYQIVSYGNNDPIIEHGFQEYLTDPKYLSIVLDVIDKYGIYKPKGSKKFNRERKYIIESLQDCEVICQNSVAGSRKLIVNSFEGVLGKFAKPDDSSDSEGTSKPDLKQEMMDYIRELKVSLS